MKLNQIAEKVEQIAPLNLAQDWDNVGLLIGDRQKEIKNILLTIDVTKEVLAEAKKLKTDLILSYHPVIWDGLRRITADDQSCVVYDLIRSDISVFSIHTALDAAIGGVNDGLSEIVGIKDAEPIGDYIEKPIGDSYKLVVFVPATAVNKVANAVYAGGGGQMGNYSNCGFAVNGQGSFLPLEGARPAIGRKGKIEKVNEVRFETIVPAEKLDAVVKAMKKAHPYEVPAYDCLKLYNNQHKYGLGRIGKLEKATPVNKITARIKKHTNAKAFGIVGSDKKTVKTAAVCAGSCGKIINLVIAAKCDLYVTGELKHHQALAAQQAGVTCICLSHTVSERFILKKLAKQLKKEIKQATIKVSKKDSDPFNWKKL
ncbi:MAG: Nif3-like dinuclear metal center hexameric protein [Planctomycetota bacterium]|jgi:dinuclear metal center YbgI/SA1388 family protein